MVDKKHMTRGVRNLLGDPKKAIVKLALPMMIGMIFQTLYNIADGIWVAGLGVNQLAAVGLFFPFFIVILALGAGVGIGGSSAISRRIGEKNKKEADNTAIHTILLGIIIALGISLPLLPFLERIFISFSGNEQVGRMAAEYARVLFGGAVILIFSNVANAILRGEGDTRRAMYALVFGSLLNIILDPIYIYVLDMGVVGAAWATLTSMIASASLFLYWLFIKRDTYLDLGKDDFHPSKKVLREILRVGIPASVAQLSMSLSMILINVIVIQTGGTDGVAVFTSGWRIIMLGIIPLIGMAMAVTSVTGAAFGAQDKEKLNIAWLYAIKIGVLTELAIGVAIAIFASQVAYLFSYSEGGARIWDDLVRLLRLTAPLYPTIPLGMLTSSMFQGIGKGKQALTVTILRTVILQVPGAYLLGIMFSLGLTGVWMGLVIGNIIAVSVSFLWGRKTVNGIDEEFQAQGLSYEFP